MEIKISNLLVCPNCGNDALDFNNLNLKKEFVCVSCNRSYIYKNNIFVLKNII